MNEIADNLTFRQLLGEEYKDAHDLSYEDYTSNRMLDVFKYRSENAPHLFLGYFADSGHLIGFVSATQTDRQTEFTEDCIRHHIPGGETLMLHRIWVHKDHRKQGIGTKLFDKFRARLLSLNPVPKRICCICIDKNIPVLIKFGFTKIGSTDVDFYKTGKVWNKMEITLDPNDKPPVQDGVTRLLKEDEYEMVWRLEKSCYPPQEQVPLELIQYWLLHSPHHLVMGYFIAEKLIGVRVHASTDDSDLFNPICIIPLHQGELDSYPPKEAASLESLQYRHHHAPHLTIGYFLAERLIGLVCGTQSDKPTLTTDSLKLHVPNGETVCIHSVCTDSNYRKQGIASRLLKSYIEHIKQLTPRPKRICLCAHDYLIPFYTKAGFKLTGISKDFQWGNVEWYGLELLLDK